MVLACPQCKSPVAREGQRFCYRCGNDLSAYYESQGVRLPDSDTLTDATQNKSGNQEAPSGGSSTVVLASTEPVTENVNPTQTSPKKATLRVLLPSGDVFDRELAKLEVQMGKGPRNDLVIADPAVSSSHAVIRQEENVYVISDLGSRNGTFINSERITGPTNLNHGDVIGVGLSKLTFRLSDYSETGAINLAEVAASRQPLPLTEESIAKAVVDAGLTTPSEVDRARSRGGRLAFALVDEKLVKDEALRDLMSRVFQIPTIRIRDLKLDESLLAGFPPKLAVNSSVLPVSATRDQMILAVADPTDSAAVNEAGNKTRKKIEPQLASLGELRDVIEFHYGPKLIGVLPSGDKLEYPIKKAEVEVGKAAHNDIVVSDPTVSNTHAVVLIRGGGYCIVDLGSRNGTFVNGERLTDKAHTLKHGDSVQLGQTVLTFRNPSETTENVTATLSAEALAEIRRKAEAEGRIDSKQRPIPDFAAAATALPGTPEVQVPDEKPAAAGEPALEKKEKKKKDKKKEGERLKAAYIGGLSRILAQVIGVVVALALALYVSQRSQSPGPSPVPGSKGIVKKLGTPPAGTRFNGGTFEASGVAQVVDGRGVLFIDDGRGSEVFFMQVDSSGKQSGEITAIPLGVTLSDPEGITFDGSYFYVVCSQAKPKDGDENALVRFSFDPNSLTASNVTVIPNFRQFLIDNVPQLRGQGEQPGTDGGLNIEGIAWDPDPEQRRLLLGLRSPLAGSDAMLVPIRLKNASGPFEAANLEVPGSQAISINLGGAGVRDIQYDSKLKAFLILSGAPEHLSQVPFGLWEWNSTSGAAPRQEMTLDAESKPEGITRLRAGGSEFIFIVCDANSYLKVDYTGESGDAAASQ